MLTIKVINANGDELVYEAMAVSHKASHNVLEYVNASGELCPVDISADKRIYVMNSNGATVSSYVKCSNLG